jgi:hypothetical protein
MNIEALFLFLILLLGLLLCSFLGGNYHKESFTGNFSGTFNVNDNQTPVNNNNFDNYNHYTGASSNLISGTTYNGPNGSSASVITNSDGSQSLQISFPGSTNTYTFSTTTDPSNNTTTESYTNYYGNNGTATVYYGPNGATATVVIMNNGTQAIKVTTPSGTYYYNISGTPSDTNISSTQYYGSTGYPIQQAPYSMSYQGPYGGSAGAVTGPNGNTAYYAQGPNGNTVAGTTNTNDYYANQYYGPYGGSAGAVTGPNGNTAYYAQGPNGNTVAGTTNDYYSSLPPGIPRNQIPPGQEDLYILKSEIVPPVCPACPTSAACPRQEPCPPCPACARCPEPAFECKKVPNYNAINNEYLPAPVLNDFSQFGM